MVLGEAFQPRLVRAARGRRDPHVLFREPLGAASTDTGTAIGDQRNLTFAHDHLPRFLDLALRRFDRVAQLVLPEEDLFSNEERG